MSSISKRLPITKQDERVVTGYQRPSRGSVCIRQGTKGNGHYIAFYWSVEAWLKDGSCVLLSGNEPTWIGALSAAETAREVAETN